MCKRLIPGLIRVLWHLIGLFHEKQKVVRQHQITITVNDIVIDDVVIDNVVIEIDNMMLLRQTRTTSHRKK